MLMQLFSITRVTFVEAIRQPIFVVLLLLGAMLMVLNPSMSAYSMKPGSGDNKVLVDLGLGTVFLVGVFLAAFTATGVVHQELTNKTALTIVSKPVPRPVFIAGKYIGVSGAIVAAGYVLMLVFLLTLRHRVLQNARDQIDWPVVLFGIGAVLGSLALAGAANYLYKKVFTSTFIYALLVTLTGAFCLVMLVDKSWQFQSPVTDFVADQGRIGQVAVGGVFLIQGLLILTAFAVALSTRFSQVVTLVVCLGVVIPIGLMAGAMNQLVNTATGIEAGAGLVESVRAVLGMDIPLARQAAYLVAKAIYVIAPNFQFHWPADAITQGNSLVHDAEGNVSLSYLGTVSAYTLAYVTAVLGLGVALFQSKECDHCSKAHAMPTTAGLYRHVVAFKFKDTATETQIAQIVEEFGKLQDDIPEIIAFEHGTNVSPEGLDQGFTHVFLVTFKEKAGLEVYLPHPAHKAFVEKLLPLLEQPFVVDYVAK
eukprot:g15152.t1